MSCTCNQYGKIISYSLKQIDSRQKMLVSVNIIGNQILTGLHQLFYTRNQPNIFWTMPNMIFSPVSNFGDQSLSYLGKNLPLENVSLELVSNGY